MHRCNYINSAMEQIALLVCSDLNHIHGAFSVVVSIDDMCILMKVRFPILLKGQGIVQNDGKAHIGICHYIGLDAVWQRCQYRMDIHVSHLL